jgi:hypothetical protein
LCILRVEVFMLVLSEASPSIASSASAHDLAVSTEVARLSGCRVYSIPDDFEACEGATNALSYLRPYEEETAGFWVGYIPSLARYQELYQAAKEKNVSLVNTPQQHQDVMEFDHAYPFLEGLTPKSVTITEAAQYEEALALLTLPIFVKGAVQSTKADGWRSCVAETRGELKVLVERLFSLSARSRGRVILRQLVKLRHTRTSGLGFPLGREFRVFLYRGEVLASGYYWEGNDPLSRLSSMEEAEMLGVALQAAKRLPAVYVAVDVGQTEDGCWMVIEAGDAQFCGASRVSLWALWGGLLARCR